MHKDINVNVSGPVQPTSTYKTKILKGNHSFASQVTEPNTKYVIKHDFVLDSDITIPNNCVLEFDGGSISGEHTITGNNTVISTGLVKIFGTDITLAGTWNVDEVYPEWFGAKGDGINDDTLYITSTIGFCENTGIRFSTLKKEYLFSSPIVFNGTYNIDVKGNLIYNGNTTSTAITIGTQTTQTNNIKCSIYKLTQINQPTATIDLETHTATVLKNVGIEIINIYNSEIHCEEIRNFNYNVIISACNATGCCYNTFYFNKITNGYQGITLKSFGGETNTRGWVNENLFINCRIVCGSNNQFKEVFRGIVIDSDIEYYSNANVFIKPCVEGAYIGAEIKYGNCNRFIETRTENVDIPITELNNSKNNVMSVSYGNVTDRYGLCFKTEEITVRDSLVYDSGIIKWAANGNNVALSKLLQNYNTTYQGTGLQFDADGYAILNFGTPSIGIPISLRTSRNKKIKVFLDGTARIIIKAYDSDNNVITNPDVIKINLDTNFTYDSSISAFKAGSNIRFNQYFCIFNFDESVDKIEFILKSQTSGADPISPFKVRRITIYGTSGIEAAINSDDNIYMNIKPTTAAEGVTKVIAKTSNPNLTHWDLINGNWIPSLHKGTTVQRPTTELTTDVIGYEYFDTSLNNGLGKMIYYTGDSTTPWVDATGATV